MEIKTIKVDNKDCVICIRKLTERECFRLMGLDEKSIDTIVASGLSKTSMYKMAGNSIVIDVLYHIFRKAFIQKGNESKQLTIFDAL